MYLNIEGLFYLDAFNLLSFFFFLFVKNIHRENLVNMKREVTGDLEKTHYTLRTCEPFARH